MPMTGFDPKTRGFAFVNYWELDQSDRDAVLRIISETAASVFSILEPIFGRVLVLAEPVLRLVWSAERTDPQSYGLCGGMAFAALDYYTARIPIPSAKAAPTRANAAGAAMRNYLQQRQLDSLRDNLGTVLAWMTVLNYIPQWWSFKSGAPWLLDRSKEEWSKLKDNIDVGQPTPLALIGTTKDPMQNHQVLAYGYDEPDPGAGAEGTGIIYVYDMNCPGVAQTIKLDFRGKALMAQESCSSPERGTLRGWMCEKYSAVLPPIVEDWTIPAPI